MKTSLALLLFSVFLCGALKNYTDTETYRCIECLCHARTGCWSRLNCANYSIDFEYWKKAGRPVLDNNDDPANTKSFNKCMKDEMCVINTIVQYIDAIGHKDCNCDGEFDCKDRLAIHLYGDNCENPKFGSVYASRFNHCALQKNLRVGVMEAVEGSEDDCAPE